MTAGQSAIDWDLAIGTAHRLMRPGSDVTASEADSVVEALRRYLGQSITLAEELSGLHPVQQSEPARVVNRGSWVDANVNSLAALLDPLIAQLEDQRGRQPGPVATKVGSRITGLQAGAVLAFLSHRVLGQYEVFGPGLGQLLVVAPNVVAAERNLGVPPADFRLWVCLHESTHQLQFTAVPWLRGFLHSEIAELITSMESNPGAFRDRLSLALRDANDSIRQQRERGSSRLLTALQSPAQRAIVDRLTALMTLLEGHAEFVMDAAGEDIIPSVKEIRERFTRRRQETSPFDRFVRRLLGIDAKMRQYAEGVVFVRQVVDIVGLDGLNAVWISPQNLPSKQEILDPTQWINRIHGHPARLG